MIHWQLYDKMRDTATDKIRAETADILKLTWCPHMRLWAANMIVFIPEAQALLTVVASVESNKPTT